jgi:hypothetical protein
MRMTNYLTTLSLLTGFSVCTSPAAGIEFDFIQTAMTPESLPLVQDGKATPLFLDESDWPGVHLAATNLQADIERVTGVKPVLATDQPSGKRAVIVGTLGKSPLIDQVVKATDLDVSNLTGQWESFLITTVTNPLPDVEQAVLVIGSDRRGTIFGIYEISRQIGVSPWYWWADVPVKHQDTLFVKPGEYRQDPPGVKYRGIFINDEDWGLHPWAAKTFDPEFGDIGPKTYAKVFELMLRLRLNYLWPAMHACTIEFSAVPENYELADRYGIVTGSSHCEPMLCNNIKWDESVQGPWNYLLNREALHSYWEENVSARGAGEAVWTIGIRGIHDEGMKKPPDDLPSQINLLGDVFRDQRDLLNRHVTTNWGTVAQSFVPYKEVLPIYDAGLDVPDDVTLVWVDDNFGFIRRLSNPEERKRSGGAGVYWHLSYYGGPHSYLWLNTTAPALMWEELHKSWENEARNLWVINVGDIKPMEIAIDYFSQLAWNPESLPLGSQREFLEGFVTRTIGAPYAQRATDLLMDFYRLGTVRKPELMERSWALALTDERAAQLLADYKKLIQDEQKIANTIPASHRDAYTQMIGFPARVLGRSGLIFMADRDVQLGRNVSENQTWIAELRDEISAAVTNFNTEVAGGKWNLFMPGIQTSEKIISWDSQVRWPWGEDAERDPSRWAVPADAPVIPEGNWRDAAAADRWIADGPAAWNTIEGLGPSGRSIALLPTHSALSWDLEDSVSPQVEFDFNSGAGAAEAWIDFLPTFRLYPGRLLRVAVAVDDGEWIAVEVPGSSGKENEYGPNRFNGVQNNYVRARVPLPELTQGRHTFKIRAMDPGAVIDRINLPQAK